jgi:nicotinamidase-related amidase
MVVIKPRVSAFYGTDLESALRARKIERVVLAGVSTTWALQAAARRRGSFTTKQPMLALC